MGADNKTGAAVRNGRQCDAPLLGLHAADQQRDIDAERLKPVGQRCGMLPGQDLGRGQQGALPAVLGGKPDGRSGNECLAAADIALQKPVHRHLAAQVAHDLLGRAALRPGGRVRQTAPERPQIQRVHRCAGPVAPVAAQKKDADLQQIQLLKDEPAPCGGEVSGILRGMDGPYRLRFGGHPVAGQQCGGQRVGQLVRIGKRRVGAGRMAAGGQPLCAGVDRHEGAGLNLCLGAHQRMQQLTAGQRPADAPLKVVALPHREIVGRVGRVEPCQGQDAGIICRKHAAHDAPAGDAAGRLLLQHGGAHAAVGVIGR